MKASFSVSKVFDTNPCIQKEWSYVSIVLKVVPDQQSRVEFTIIPSQT